MTLYDSDYYTSTGYIPVKKGSVVNVKGMSFSAAGDGFCRVVLVDSDYNYVLHCNRDNLIGNSNYHIKHETTDDGCIIYIQNVVSNNAVAYMVMTVYHTTVSNNPVIAVDEEIGYTQAGFLADAIHVKEESLIGMEGYEKKNRLVTSITGNSTDEQYPSAKAVYTVLQSALGEYVSDVAALIGGDA